MKFSIVANPKQPNMKKILTKVIGFLEDFDLEEESAKIIGLKGNPIEQLEGEMVISLGGDGTLLFILDNLNKPVFGINCGGVGFLTEIEHSDDMFNAFKRLESKNYELQKLGRIDAFINDLHVGTALNEVVLHSSRVAKIQGFEVEIDGSIADSFRGDGIKSNIMPALEGLERNELKCLMLKAQEVLGQDHGISNTLEKMVDSPGLSVFG